MEPFERYRDIVDDFEAFLAACERPLPMAVRVNTLKTTTERVTEAFDEAGIGYEQADWHPHVLRLDTEKPGSTWPGFHGWTTGQEEVSAIPPTVLDPQPGERVFDTCAAPGSKTTQLAAGMGDTGTLVANDNNLGRLSALRFNCERLGVTNVVVTNQDARNFSLKPFDGKAFDRVLVDAPCSCEGTIRKNPDALDNWNMGHVTSVAGVQKGILKRALQVTREGGTVVYSTCTFAPEENEAVLDHVLEEEDCRVVDYDLALEHVPGVTEWEGEAYDPQVAKAKRVYPHHNDTGGFFTAKLEVTA
ncbi:RsmB/NOP family class I SAM-dependent RNA methyltransferase [Haloarchaeobius amylolyticus]|uniref:RsmB/NOP family class I SAM-dependent RNA methyltransferase n=1 Tax=Haloarchaeobius amylolyticus TaxID=1198296 RepID=UPI0022711EA1|nr:RsmB/NOP family class I SAM-dependent RNA methyltransferase [Haloarchaeobius amylolyticus]